MATLDYPKDYHYYYRWTFTIPVSLLASIVTFGLITPCIVWLSSCCIKKCCRSGLADHTAVFYLRNFIRDILIRASKYFLLEFDYSVDTKDHNEPYKSCYSYTMYGAIVEFYVLQCFFIVFVTLVLVSFILFWNTFTSNVFIGCDPHLDRFPLHTNNETPISTDPLQNCSNYSGNENVTVLCFQLVYRYSEGIGEAGGFLFIMQVIANLLIYIAVRIRTTSADIYIQVRKRYTKKSNFQGAKFVRTSTLITTMILMPISYALVTMGIPLGFYQIRPEFYASLQTPQRFLQFLIYLLINFVLLLIPIFVGHGTRDNLPVENQVSESSIQEKQNGVSDNQEKFTNVHQSN